MQRSCCRTYKALNEQALQSSRMCLLLYQHVSSVCKERVQGIHDPPTCTSAPSRDSLLVPLLLDVDLALHIVTGT